MSDEYEISREIQTREAQIEVINRINSLHDESCDDSALNEALVRKVNKCRDCGVELIALSKKMRGGFKAAFSQKGNQLPFRFSYETAKIYMRIAKANPNPISSLPDAVRCLKDAWIASGGLPAPQGHGHQALHTFDFIGGINKKIFSLRTLWGNEVKKIPLEQWDEDRKEAAREELRWAAQAFVTLGGQL